MKKACFIIGQFRSDQMGYCTVCFRAHAKGNSFCNNESEIVFSVFIRSGNISVASNATW